MVQGMAERSTLMTERTNEEWLAALRDPDNGQVLTDLREYLIRGLGYALSDRPAVTEADIQDFVHDALLKTLAALDTFRGESRFTTWAQKIAIHVAFTELRRRRWRDVSLESTLGSPETDFVPYRLADESAGPEEQAIQSAFVDALRRVIAEELTDRQRQALVAVVIQGVPIQIVADKMGTNRNALYKLLHDARQRLKARIVAEDITPQEVLAAFEV
jgi:RNA polymerase sigma-70 factor, ECF subfamily